MISVKILRVLPSKTLIISSKSTLNIRLKFIILLRPYFNLSFLFSKAPDSVLVLIYPIDHNFKRFRVDNTNSSG